MRLFVFLIISPIRLSPPSVQPDGRTEIITELTENEIIRKRAHALSLKPTQDACPLSRLSTHPPTSHTRAQSAWRGASSRHHPSAAPRNGLHDWLNRLTIALAKKHRIGVANVTDAVMAFAPAARGIRDAPGLRSPEGDYILPCRPAVATLLAAVAQRVCSGCGRPWG